MKQIITSPVSLPTAGGGEMKLSVLRFAFFNELHDYDIFPINPFAIYDKQIRNSIDILFS